MKFKSLVLMLVLSISSCSAQRLQEITVINDGRYEGTFFLNTKGQIIRYVFKDSTEYNEIVYTYSSDDKIKKISSIDHISGKIQNSDNDDFDEEMKHCKDAIYRTTFLEQKGIQFPLSFINSSELGDMANVFSVRDKYQTRVQGLEKFIIFDSLNLKISFRSSIEKYIPHLTVINKYKVTLNGENLANEEFVFEGGILARSYSYDKKSRLTSIVWTCVYDGDPKKYSEIKKFSYVDGG